MRLKQHLNEITKVDDKEVKKIIDKSFAEFEKMSKTHFWPILYQKLLVAFHNYNIVFYSENGMFGKKVFNDKSKAVTFMEKDMPLIAIALTKKEIKNLKKGSELHKIKNRLFNVILHELTHRKQHQKKSTEYIDFMNNNYDKFIKSIKGDFKGYLADKEEVEAYARQAVSDLEASPESDIIYSYMKLEKNTKQRFLKKFYQYMDMYGSDKAKENLKKSQIKTI